MVDERLDSLCAALERTAERPLPRSANRWLGEAQAVAMDLREGDPDPETTLDRLETVEDLLAEVEGTGDEAADLALEEANELLENLLGELRQR
jgi:hypothetical protein